MSVLGVASLVRQQITSLLHPLSRKPVSAGKKVRRVHFLCPDSGRRRGEKGKTGIEGPNLGGSDSILPAPAWIGVPFADLVAMRPRRAKEQVERLYRGPPEHSFDQKRRSASLTVERSQIKPERARKSAHRTNSPRLAPVLPLTWPAGAPKKTRPRTYGAWRVEDDHRICYPAECYRSAPGVNPECFPLRTQTPLPRAFVFTCP